MIPEDKFDLIIEILRQQDKRFGDFRDEINRRFEQVDKRFEQIDKRFEQIDKRFEQMERQFSDFRDNVDSRFAELKELIREDRQQLKEIHASRDKVKVTFGWQWAAISLSIAMVAVVLGGSVALTFFR